MQRLSPYQTKIRSLVALGYSNREVAAALKTSEQAVKSALHTIFDKMGVSNRVELVHGLTQGASAQDKTVLLNRIEEGRLAAVMGTLCSASQVQNELDDLVSVAAAVCDVPIALLTIVEAKRIWFQSACGMNVQAVARESSFCESAIQGSRLVEIQDATQDDRFARHPLVLAKPHIRFYAAVPLLTPDGYALGTLCVIDRVSRKLSSVQQQGLTRLGRMAQNLLFHRGNAQFETLLQNAPLGVYLVDADFRIRQANSAALPVFGDIPDLIGRNFEEVIHLLWPQAYADEIVQRFRHTLETGEPYVVSERAETRLDRGFRECYEWKISRIPLADGYGVVCYFRDLSRQESDRARIAESAERTATRLLAAAVAHEINNPMQALMNLLGLLKSKSSLDMDAHSLTDMAQVEVKRMAYITKQMLSFHRDSQMPVPVRITEVLEEVLELLAIQYKGGFRVGRHYDFAEPIEAFPGEMRQVFLNLISNALEASQAESPITLRVHASPHWKHPERRGVRVVVADSGPGIPKKNHKNIFEAFFTTKDEKGTGLGLWVAKGIVERHGGHVQFRSSTSPDRRGTVFSVFLPLQSNSSFPSLANPATQSN